MEFDRRAAMMGGIGLLAGAAVAPRAFALDNPLTDLFEGAEDFLVASDAYIYGYPLVTMEMTRRVMTNVAESVGTRAPMGRLIKASVLPGRPHTVTSPPPNADTLYTDRLPRRRSPSPGCSAFPT